MGVHDGHRERLRKRFLEEDLDNFDDKHVLELLLFYCIPRKDTGVIAYNLIQRFKSLSGVLDATRKELQSVEGVGENVACYLSLIASTGRFYRVNKGKEITILPSLPACAEYLKPYFQGRTNETVFLLCMDAKCKVLGCREVGEGSVNAASISTRRIVEIALSYGASSVVMAHNHPSGIALPSPEDILTTKQIAIGLAAVDITLTDHIIVADEDLVSLAQSGLYNFREIQEAMLV